MTNKELDAEALRRMPWLMVSCHVVMPAVRGRAAVGFFCYLMPHECLDRAHAFVLIGAESILLNEGSRMFQWIRPAPTKRRKGPSRVLQVLAARLDADRLPSMGVDPGVLQRRRYVAETPAWVAAHTSAVVPARLDKDRTAKPLTEIVGHARQGDCIGPDTVQADTYRATRYQIKGGL
jgi:hypothetical protein